MIWGGIMRVFIGIELHQHIKEYLFTTQRIIKSGTIKGDFTRMENFHLTLKYIGHVNEEEIEDLEDAIDLVCDHTKAFTITINGIGSFDKKTSSIVWVGIASGRQELKHLFQRIDKETVKLGFLKEERRYRPHITLGKKIVFSPFSRTEFIPPYEEPVQVKKITLFHSDRIDGVLTYTPIYSQLLKEED